MARGRVYNCPIASTATTVVRDLLEILTAATHICVIKSIELYQSTEVGDAQEEMLVLNLKSGQTTSGSGGNTGVTAVPILLGDSPHGMTIESMNTTQASAGTIVTHKTWAWNLRINPFIYTFTPETELVIPPSTRATLSMDTTPADSVTIGGMVTLEIIG